MTPDNMIANVRSMLSLTGTTLDSQILTELQLAQVKLEGASTLPWFLLTEKYTDASTEQIEVPSDFLKEYEDSALWWVTSEGTFKLLEKGFQDELRAYWNQETTGDDDTNGPRAYSLIGSHFHVFPTPSETYRFRMYYYKQDATLSAGGAENLWGEHLPDLLMGLAGQNLLLHHGILAAEKQVSLGRFNQMVQEGSNRMITQNVAREMTNMELCFGGG